MRPNMLARTTLLRQSLRAGSNSTSTFWLIFSIFIMLTSAAAFALAPIFLGRWVELIRTGENFSAVKGAFGAYLLLYAGGYFFRDAQWSTYSRFERAFFTELTMKVYRENLGSRQPRTETELSMGMQGVQGFLFSFLFLVLPYGLEAAAAVVSILLSVSLSVGSVFAVFCVGYVILLQWSTKQISRKNRQFIPSIQRAFGLIQSLLSARTLVRRSGAISFSERLVLEKVQAQEGLRVGVADKRAETSVLVNAWVMISLAAALGIGIYSYHRGSISFGSLVATESFFFQIMRRLEIWARGFRESAMYGDQVSSVLSPPADAAEPMQNVPWKDSPAFRAGEPGWTIIQGATGAGKSTLLKGWADAAENEGSYVGQFPEFLPLSIEDNLCMGIEVPAERLQDVLRRLDLSAVIARLPLGLKTELGEGGAPLSGGELQRLCLARAALLNRDTVFLDEPTSSQPEANEPALIRELMSLFSGKRVVCVSHRSSFNAIAQQSLRCEPFGKLAP